MWTSGADRPWLDFATARSQLAVSYARDKAAPTFHSKVDLFWTRVMVDGCSVIYSVIGIDRGHHKWFQGGTAALDFDSGRFAAQRRCVVLSVDNCEPLSEPMLELTFIQSRHL
jgi:hypothetical protein